MKFLIISHVLHKSHKNQIWGYGPYIREMNIWEKYVDELMVIAPIKIEVPNAIDLPYTTKDVEFIRVPVFNLVGFKNIITTIATLPWIFWKIFWAMKSADHIHLRCPGNMGLTGAIVQIFFPNKKKTAKYAGNWDWNSQQPLSYRIQQVILRNNFITRNMKVLVYGEWPDRTANIIPFFTASYSELDRTKVFKPDLRETVRLAFVGSLTENKRPLTAAKVLRQLTDYGIAAHLTYCGEGPERTNIAGYADQQGLNDKLDLLGNVSQEKVKEVLSNSHFLIFISRSEGWPKAVAEAMWWGCIPITTAVSCVPEMVDHGERGFLIEDSSEEIVQIILDSSNQLSEFSLKMSQCMEWSRDYTIERFEKEIEALI